MAISRRHRILILFGLVLLLLTLAGWIAYSRNAGRAEAVDPFAVLLLALFLVLILGLAAASLHAERWARERAEQEWRAQAELMQARVRQRSEELAVVVDALQKRFTQTQRVEEALRESEHQARAQADRLEVLSRRLLEAQEMERRRVARELHDEIGQVMTAVKIHLQAMQRTVSPEVPLPRLKESLDIVDRALQQVRNLSLELRPAMLDDLGLVSALRWYVDRQANRAGFQGHFSAEPPDIQVAAELATGCFRIVQEAFTNILRHAQAGQVTVELRADNRELHLAVRDDGRGFDPAAAWQRAARGGSLGLLGMEERVHLLGGRMDLRSQPGQGTEIEVHLPLPPGPAGG
jgi:signal transduction histidine kinase